MLAKTLSAFHIGKSFHFEVHSPLSPRRRPRKCAHAAAAVGLALALPALAQDIQERTIRFGHLNNPDHPVSLGTKRFAELVAAKSGGKITVKEFPSMQLGSEMQQQSALQG